MDPKPVVKPGIASIGNHGITKTGTGTVTLAGPSTYTGNTTVIDGTLSIGVPNFSASSTLTIGTAALSPAVLNLPIAGTQIVAALVIDGVPMAAGKYSEAPRPRLPTSAMPAWRGGAWRSSACSSIGGSTPCQLASGKANPFPASASES